MTDLNALTRRAALRRAGLAGAALTLPAFLAACGGDSGSEAATGTTASGGTTAAAAKPKVTSKSVVFADYGGAESDAHKEIFFKQFTKETGCAVKTVTNDPAKFRLMSQRGRSVWDIAELDGFQAIQLFDEGLLAESPEWVTKCDLVPEKYRAHAPGLYAYSMIQGYKDDAFSGAKPETWADFFDVKKFPGKRAVPNFYYGVAEAALLADGVAKEDLYPLDFDRAFAKLDTLKGNVLFTESYGEGQQFVQSGSVKLALLPNGRFLDLKQKGEKVTMVWNEAVLFPWGACGIPKGAPHEDAAYALADAMAQPAPQAAYAKRLGYGPLNSKAFELLSDAELADVPNSPVNTKIAALADNEALAKQNDEYAKRYEQYLTKS
jgi:putative spermidine/putrescine transport system substrate-binding protein